MKEIKTYLPEELVDRLSIEAKEKVFIDLN